MQLLNTTRRNHAMHAAEALRSAGIQAELMHTPGAGWRHRKTYYRLVVCARDAGPAQAVLGAAREVPQC